MTRSSVSTRCSRERPLRRVIAVAASLVAVVLAFGSALPAQAASYVSINGEGSSWAGQAWQDWQAQAANQGVTIGYTANGSSLGRDDFSRETNAVFADSEIPFKGSASDPQDNTYPPFKYGLLPVVAGGTAFMYNLPIGGSRFDDLKLSMADVAGIFSGKITQWNDPQLAKDNPGVTLPSHVIQVVVRADGSGATAQFKLWMLRQFPADYKYLVSKTGGSATSASSYFPVGSLQNFTSQQGSAGVTTYTTHNEYTIDFDEYAYAQSVGFPVAKVKNAAGYYTTPTASAVAVALTQAVINDNPADPNYLSQDLSKVYTYGDPRTYTMSLYSYEIEPKQTNSIVGKAQGATLAWVTTNAVCEWQREMGALGYSPLPMNLVLASLAQVLDIPGIDAATVAKIKATQTGALSGGANPCNNPTFKPGDDPSHNVLVDTAAFPAGCTAACQAPWKLAGTGTAVSGPKFSTTGKSAAIAATGASGNSSSTSTSGGTSAKASVTATSAATTAAGTGTKVCDADTGTCTLTDAVASGANVAAVPTVVGGQTGWAGPQTLAVLIGILAAAVLLAPPLITRALRRRRGGGSR